MDIFFCLWATAALSTTFTSGSVLVGFLNTIYFAFYPAGAPVIVVQDYPYTQLAQWVVQAVKPESTFELPFSEYVHMVAYFVMLASKELMKFLFHAADTDGKYYLT